MARIKGDCEICGKQRTLNDGLCRNCEKEENMIEAMYIIFKIFSDKRYTDAFVARVEEVGKELRRSMDALQGKEEEKE